MPNQRLRETLNENDVEDGDFIDTYNRSVQKVRLEQLQLRYHLQIICLLRAK